ncbi:MAG: hypothetical protein ACI81R_000999 [Bradymonadia bacterium]|jgi:hypothetical protein
MTTRILSTFVSSVLALGFIALGSASCESGGGDGPLLDSNTNWLRACDSSEACGTDFVCECGVCAPECGSNACVPGEATCALDGVEVHERLCGDDDLAQICVPNCGVDDGCTAGNECIEGLCTPQLATPDASTSDVDAADTGFTEDGDSDGVTSECPPEWALYCGPVFGLEAHTLYRCEAGEVTTESECAEVCLGRPTGEDQCGERCPPGEELVCGASLGVDGDDLYRCTVRGARFERPCPAGCEERAGNDICAAE